LIIAIDRSGIAYVFGVVLRLGRYIQERMQLILNLLDANDGIEVYKKEFISLQNH
jgi:hypothetical protein